MNMNLLDAMGNKINLETKEDIINFIKDNGDCGLIIYLDMNNKLCLDYTHHWE